MEDAFGAGARLLPEDGRRFLYRLELRSVELAGLGHHCGKGVFI